jgi:N-acetylmuramoyl-L-alanine amidase
MAMQTGYAQDHLTAKSKSGEGVFALLRRFLLPTDVISIAKFKELNKDRLPKNEHLHKNHFYKLPVLLMPYDGLSITSSLGLEDRKRVDQIDLYNFRTYEAGLRTLPYTRSKELWVPLHLWSPTTSRLDLDPLPTLPDRQVAAIRSGTPLQEYMFYLDAGHGGPDPGAIGRRGKVFLYEDEYAYDITLRLSQRLQEFGAAVKMIVQDPDDGIREDAILAYDVDERYCDNTAISHDLAQRLADRAAIVNRMYRRNKARFRNQIALIIHVDSRSNSQRVDIFYYHQEGVKESRELAATLHETIESKYKIVQPGRGYSSSISSRDLHMLSALDPVAVYIELGNIRNPKDQDRFIIPDNRQAVANWLCDGLIAAARKKK